MPNKFILVKVAVPSKFSFLSTTKVPKKGASSEAREASVKKNGNSTFFVTEQ